LHGLASLNAVLIAVRQHREETCALDSGVKLALKNGTGASQARGDDLAILGNEIAQRIDVFLIDFFNAGHRETAKAFALKQQVLGWALGALVFVIETFWSGHDGLLKYLRIR
jgi:3-phosphoglycerate kinase